MKGRKTRLLALILATAILTALTGCNRNNNLRIFGEDTLDYWHGLRLEAAEGSVTPTGLNLSIINDSEDITFGYGSRFRVERYLNGRWRQVRFVNEVMWTLMLFVIEPNSIIDDNINWKYVYGELQPGRYRLVRSFMEYDPFETESVQRRDIPRAYLYATFTIE